MSDLSPRIIAPDADAVLGFLADVFGAVETGRVPRPDGTLGHAETRIGDAAVVVLDAPEGWAAAPAYLRLVVADLDGVVARALAAGAREVTARTSLPFGDDVVRLADPWGNLWWVQQHVEDVDLQTLLGRMGDPASLATMGGFEASLDTEMRARAGRPTTGLG